MAQNGWGASLIASFRCRLGPLLGLSHPHCQRGRVAAGPTEQENWSTRLLEHVVLHDPDTVVVAVEPEGPVGAVPKHAFGDSEPSHVPTRGTWVETPPPRPTDVDHIEKLLGSAPNQDS